MKKVYCVLSLLGTFLVQCFVPDPTSAQCTYLKGVVPMPCDGCPEEGRHEVLVYKTGSDTTQFKDFELYASTTNPPPQTPTDDYFRNGFRDAGHSDVSSDMNFYNGVSGCDTDLMIPVDTSTKIPPESYVIVKHAFSSNVSPALHTKFLCPEKPVYVIYRDLASYQLTEVFPNDDTGNDPEVYLTAKTEFGCSQTYSYDPDSLVVDTADNNLAGAWVMFDENGNTLAYGNNGEEFPLELLLDAPDGALCETAIEADLPYSVSGLSTAPMGNYYDLYRHAILPINDCQTSGELAEGYEVVFHFVPTCDSVEVDFSSDKDRYSAYLQKGCYNGTCIFNKFYQFGAYGFTEKAEVTPGKDYYVLIDSRVGADTIRTIDLDITCVGGSVPTSVDQVRKKAGLAMFPNPSTGQVNLTGLQNGSVKVFAADGRLVQRHEKIPGNDFSFSLDRRGLFLVKVRSAEQSEVFQLEVY